MTRVIAYGLAAVLVGAAPAWGQVPGEPDAEGCKDSKLLTRMAGCTIVECSTKEFDRAELQIKPVNPDTNVAPKQELEGAFEQIRYYCPAKYSLLQIARNAENALKPAGFTIVFSGKSEDDWPMITARKGEQWISVTTFEANEYVGYEFTALQAKAMDQQLRADASAMAAEINKTGSVAVYGINFDTGKATLQAGSEQVLAEIVKLLTEHDEWKFEVQGHTDNVGPKAANLSLSEQRARAVVTWLTGRGIAAARLVAKGYGDSVPLAGNDTPEGRAKNRRVELKKLNEE